MEQQASKKTRNPLGRWAVGSKRFMRAEFGGAGASTNSADATAFTHAHNWAKSDTCAKSNADGRSKSDAHNRADTPRPQLGHPVQHQQGHHHHLPLPLL